MGRLAYRAPHEENRGCFTLWSPYFNLSTTRLNTHVTFTHRRGADLILTLFELPNLPPTKNRSTSASPKNLGAVLKGFVKHCTSPDTSCD